MLVVIRLLCAQMRETHRSQLVSWMTVVSSRQFRFHDETLFLAVNVLDRFLVKTSVAADCFQLLAVASLLVAAKMVSYHITIIIIIISNLYSAYYKKRTYVLQ